MVQCRVIAPDIRGHGSSKCEDESDLSIDRRVVYVFRPIQENITSKKLEDHENFSNPGLYAR